MLRVTQPSREQLERKRSSDTHWPNPKRHKHRGTPRTSSCVIVAGGRVGKERLQVGLDLGAASPNALPWEISSHQPGTVSIQVSPRSGAERWGSSRSHSASATSLHVLG